MGRVPDDETRSERVSQIVEEVSPHGGRDPLPAIDAHPRMWDRQPAGEQAAREDVLPAPRPWGDLETHGGGGAVASSLRDPLDQVAPADHERGTLQDGVGPSAEGDGLAAVVRLAVTPQLVEHVGRS